MKALAFLVRLEHELNDETIRARATRRTMRLTRVAKIVRRLVSDDRRLTSVWDRALDKLPDDYSAEDLMLALRTFEEALTRRTDVCAALRNTLLPILKRSLSDHQAS